MPLWAWTRKLEFPQKEDTIETIHRSILDLIKTEKGTFFLPEEQKYLIFRDPNIKISPKSNLQFTDSSRIPLISANRESSWTAFEQYNDHLLLLDGATMSMSYLSQDLKETISMHTLVFDLIKPPRDSRGEAAPFETKELRSKFLKSLHRTKSPKLVGLKRAPKLDTTTKFRFFASTRIQDYPLITIECSKDSPSQCALDRACFVEDMPSIDSNSLSGLAYDPENKFLLLVDINKHRVLVLHFQSCFHTVYIGQITLPEKIKQIIGVALDEEQNLYILSRFIDDYYNASVYRFNKSRWLPEKL